MMLDYSMDLEMHHDYSSIVQCATEVASYVGNHDNWLRPIIPADGDCAEMVFTPDQFDHRGNFWRCDESGKCLLYSI